ncbi:AAA domain-containing protein [Sphingobacterium bambusae]|uniref:AAA domain-containing protein n=1 Tax=Sphingobacterium bambusae TaxID=662858 RepID=A0ABW6BGA0_9SPHI|nr:AAA domain-containing protein [Sphingobacterium bambusae]WPL49556.1 AAA domain-containing protein [Sphingobacterium bambusae]
MNYFDGLAALLNEEQNHDRNLHESLLRKSNLQERKAQGVTWFPIAVVNSELGRGDYLTITVRKTNNSEEGHRFRFGMPVAIFSNYNPEEDRVQGIIAYVGGDSMRISFRLDELPDWSRRGKLGVDLLFDENAYREMHEALIRAKELHADLRQGKHIRQLLGEESFYPVEETAAHYQNEHLNASQNRAIAHVLGSSPLSILHGPPGTGKTTTLIHAVQALLKQNNKQILLVAPSNTAVDVLTERLDDMGISVVRIGNPVRVSDHLQSLTLDAKAEKHPARKEVKTLAKQANAYLDMAHKYKRNFGKLEREQRKALFGEARKLRTEIDKIQDFIVADIVDKTQVITATLVGANHHTIRDRKYAMLVIDEAAQALEPACWIPLLKAEKVLLAGDHCQLPPTVKSVKKMGEGLFVTLFEKLVASHPDRVSLLDVQYRMHEKIMKYPSSALYADRLVAAASVSSRTLDGDDAPILFIDTAGAGFEENEEDGAISNVEEALFLKRHLLETFAQLKDSYNSDNFPSVGIIAPYRKQTQLLKEMVQQDEAIHPFLHAIQVNTIDSFQGQEKDVIYISLTRSNAEQQIGFLQDVRRMNVAMTRAKKKLIVLGDSGTIGEYPFYKEFIRYVESIGHYHSVWEWGLDME